MKVRFALSICITYQPCHWYAPTRSDEGLSSIEVWDVSVRFNDDAFQNLTSNVNPLRYPQSRGIDSFIDTVKLTKNLTLFIYL